MRKLPLPDDIDTTRVTSLREKSFGGRLMKSSAGAILSLAPIIGQTLRSSVSPIVLGGLLASSMFAGKSDAQCTDSGSTTTCSGTISAQVVKTTSTNATAEIVLSANASADVSETPSNGHLFIMNSTGSGATAGDITFRQAPDGGDLEVSGSAAGIVYMNAQGDSGSADISITLTGDISQDQGRGAAIKTRGGGNTSITAADIDAYGTGISVLALGAVTISAGTISSGRDGINITGAQTGNIDVTVAQVATASSSNYAIKITGAGSNIEVNATSIPTSGSGVYITNTGTGTITFSAGLIGSGTSAARGLRIKGGSGAINVTLSGAVSATDPIHISSTGTASITISSTSSITATGSGNDGIYINAAKARGVDITVNDMSATKHAIHIRALSGNDTGEYNITVNGNVDNTATGDIDHAISLWRGLQGGSATILIASGAKLTTSGGAGISLINFPLGTFNDDRRVDITISGKLYGAHSGLYARPVGSMTIITSGIISASRTISTSRGISIGTGDSRLNAINIVTVNGGQVEGQYASITNTFGGETEVTINSGTISGRVYLRDGNDILTLNGGTISTSELDGGTEDRSNQYLIDQDKLVFNNSWSLGLAQIKDWENIYVNSGATVTITGSGDIQTEDVHVSGTLSFSNSATTDHMKMIGLLNRARDARRDTNLRGTGTIVVDVNLGTGAADQITVNGNIIGNKTIRLNDITPAATTTRTNSEVTVVTVTDTVAGENFKLENNNKFGSGGWVYTLDFKSASKTFVLKRQGRGTVLCVESTTVTGTFNCSGNIISQETLSPNNDVVLNIDASATVNVPLGRVFNINSYAAVTITQAANGGSINAGVQANGIIYAYARRATYTVGNGLSITLTGTANFAGAGTAIYGRATGSRNTISISIADLSATHTSGKGLSIGGQGPSITVSTKAVTTGSTAIEVNNRRSGLGSDGSITINTSGAVTAGGVGIKASTRSGDITINTSASVTGNPKAIEATVGGGGNANLAISGNVSAGTQSGRTAIDTITSGGSATIKIHSGTITGGGNAIQNNDGASSVILYSGAVISGNISLGGGNDAVTLNSGSSISGNVNLGAGDDTLTLSGGTWNTNTVFSGGTNTGAVTENDNIVFNSGSNEWDASKFTLWEKITVASAATLTFDGTSSLTGISMVLDGTASMNDGAVGDTLTIGGSLSGPTATTGGIFDIDVNLQTGAADTITVSGNVTGQHVIKLNNITPANASITTSAITIVTVTGTVAATALSLENAAFSFGNRLFQLSFSSSNKTFNLISRPGTTVCTESSSTTGAFTCSGTIGASEYMILTTSDPITTTLDNSATVNVQSGIALYLGGSGNVTFTQEASGNQISATGTATGVVHANTFSNQTVSITLTNTASLAGSGTAIKATGSGTGNVTVTVVNVTASHSGGTAIEATSVGGNIQITAAAIVGGKAGIVAKNTGSTGGVTISTAQTITSSDGYGIDAYNAGDGNISITATGNITTKTHGIKAVSVNSGNISITAQGSVTNDASAASNGILATISGEDSTGDITISAKDVSASKDVIEASHEGSGSISINVSGDILFNATTGSDNAGIFVHNNSSADNVSVTVQSGSTVSGQYGIFVDHNGTGSVTITSNGEVTGTANEAIWVYNATGTDVNLTVHTVTGEKQGISIDHNGTGSATVTVLSGGSVTGKSDGIKIDAETNALISITASGSVTGQEKDGIYVKQTDFSGNITVDVMAVTGAEDGIDARNTDSGGGNITITARAAVTGSAIGITATHKGNQAGTVSVNTSAAVTGNSGAGIYAYGKNGTVSVSAADTVSGGLDGIKVVNKHTGTSNAAVMATAQVTGSGGHGITVLNESQGGITVTANAVTGSTDGINANNLGGGSIGITVSGNVTGDASKNRAGIAAENDSAGDNISITAQSGTTVDGGYGIFAYNDGDGSITIESSGSIMGRVDEGLYVYNVGTTTNVTVSSVTGKTNGIKLLHHGTETGTLTVAAGGSVTGEEQGIEIEGESDGDISVVAAGAITGSSGDGIYVMQSGAGAVSITTTSTVSGGEDGIDLRKHGTGNVTVRAAGTVTAAASSDDDGIYVYKNGSGDILVTTSEISGDDEGLDIRNYGTGSTTAQVNGAITGSGTDESDAGIFLYNDASGSLIDFSVGRSGTVRGNIGVLIDSRSSATTTVNISGAVTGSSRDGLEVNARSGDISIIANANVTGADSQVGIDTYTDGGSTSINLTGGTVTAANGTAIRNDEGDSTITVRRGASIGSDVSLGGGADLLTFSGGTFASGTKLDGGEDSGTDSSVDVLTFNSGTTTLIGADLLNWERISVASGATVVSSGTNTIDATQFDVSGTISMRNNTVGDTLTVTGNVSGNSTMTVDANFSAGTIDTLNVRGNLTGRIIINLRDATPSALTTRTTGPITVVSVSGTVSANAVSLFGDASFGSRGYVYTLSYNRLAKTFVLTGEPGAKNCETTGGVNFICAGTITETENIVGYGAGNLTATLNGSATVNVTSGVAFNLFGQGNATFTQSANGNTVNASSSATGVIVASTTGNGAISVTLTGTATLAGSGTAILATSSGTGNISLQVAGVTASHSDATAVMATGAGSSVSISTNGAIVGGKGAIVARNTSTTGSASVTTSGTVTSSGGNAIMVSSSGNMTITTSGNITGNNFGIHAETTGTVFANVQVSSNATVTGTTMAGIHAKNMSNGSLSVSASAVTGQTNGIVAMHSGTGAITVNTTGAISGTTEYGLNVSNGANGRNITVSATSTVNGAKGGILVAHNGVGNVDVNTSNTVSSSSAGTHGISVNHTGTGNVTINVSGTVTGGTTGAGIHAQARRGSVNIVLNSGAVIGSAGGMAIANGSGNASVTINSGATLSGSLKLGSGTDNLTIAGGSLGTSELDGGSDSGTDRSVDVLTFGSGSSALTTSRLMNWERIVVPSGASLSSTHPITIETDEFDLKGTLSLQDQQANDVFAIDGNLAGGGTLKIDVDYSQSMADRITVTGNATGATKIEIADITPANAGSRSERITLATVEGTSSASTFSLAGSPQILSAGYIYTLDFDSQSKSYLLRGNSIVGTLLLSTPIALFDGFAKAPSLHQRLGGVVYHGSDSDRSRYWTRTFSRTNDYDGSVYDKLSHDNSVLGFQIGADTIIQDNENGKWILGANLSNYTVESSVTVDANVADLEATGFGVGGTATWYANDGSYVDIQGQLIRVTATVDSELLPDLLDDDRSTAMYLSAEYGYLFFDLNDLNIYGVAQVSWGEVGLGQASTSAGVLKLDIDGGLTLRAGVMAEFEQDTVDWYAIANVVSESTDEWSIRFAGERFTDRTSSLLAEINAGVSSDISTNIALFAQGNFITSIDGHDNSRSSFGLSAGIKYSW